jgi:glycosyltransferase involved in cell wall biosynthesis
MIPVSVVIPSYNRAHCILETLESVYSQTFRDFEVVIIDDGSTDNTREVLAPFGDRIRYIHQENRGLAGARNRGIAEARGEWIAFLDSDDLWLPEKLELQFQAVTRSPDLAVHVTNATIFREHIGQETDLYGLTNFLPSSSDSTRLDRPLITCVSKGLAWMQCALIRKETLLKAGDFRRELRIYMDFEMGSRLSLLGPWEACHKPLVRILRQDDGEVESISSKSNTPEGRKELINVYSLMAALEGLNAQERDFLQRRLSDTRASLGMRQIAEGLIDDGRNNIRAAFRDYPRTASFAKLCAVHAPTPLRDVLLRKLFPNSSK